MRYARFLRADKNGKHIGACGTDSVYILDGRYSLQTCADDSIRKLFVWRNGMHPEYEGFRIIEAESIREKGVILRTYRLIGREACI